MSQPAPSSCPASAQFVFTRQHLSRVTRHRATEFQGGFLVSFFLLSLRFFFDDIFSLIALTSLVLPCAHPRTHPHSHPCRCYCPLSPALSSPHRCRFLQPHRGSPALPPSQSHYRPPHALTNALDNLYEPSTCCHRASPSTGSNDNDSTLD